MSIYRITCKTHASETDGFLTVKVKVSDLTGEKLNYKVDGTAEVKDVKFEYRVSMDFIINENNLILK